MTGESGDLSGPTDSGISVYNNTVPATRHVLIYTRPLLALILQLTQLQVLARTYNLCLDYLERRGGGRRRPSADLINRLCISTNYRRKKRAAAAATALSSRQPQHNDVSDMYIDAAA
jgi:hypothetical protein